MHFFQIKQLQWQYYKSYCQGADNIQIINYYSDKDVYDKVSKSISFTL